MEPSWNPVVYTSHPTLPLAVLELLVHLDDDDLAQGLRRHSGGHSGSRWSINRRSEPRIFHGNWRSLPRPQALADLGEPLGAARVRPRVLAVPSAIIPHELNYLLNPLHPHFKRIRIGRPEPFSFDPRLWKP